MRDLYRGDVVNLIRHSYIFGIKGCKFQTSIPANLQHGLTVLETNLRVNKFPTGKSSDLLVCDIEGNFWFLMSNCVRLVNPEIEVKYFCDGEDVTDKISDETKRDLRAN